MFSMLDAKTGRHSSETMAIFSHGTVVVLLMLYMLWLVFKRTHSYIWDDEVAGLEPEDNHSNHPLMDSALLIYGIAVASLAVCAVICTRSLMLSIADVVNASHITRSFIGVILLPGIINLSSYAKTIAIAYRGETDLALHLTLETSIENTYLTLPLLVLISWATKHPMLLDFQFLESIILFVSVLLTSAMVAKGKTNYIEGVMCVGL
jgi:Ca2+:H+ antiporter